MKKIFIILLTIILFGCINKTDERGFYIDGEKIGYNKKTKTKYDELGYDRYGYNKKGWNKNFWNRNKINKETNTIFDKNGYNFYGFDKNGLNKETGTKKDKDGYDFYGFNEYGINKETNYSYDVNGDTSKKYIDIIESDLGSKFFKEIEIGKDKRYETASLEYYLKYTKKLKKELLFSKTSSQNLKFAITLWVTRGYLSNFIDFIIKETATNTEVELIYYIVDGSKRFDEKEKKIDVEFKGEGQSPILIRDLLFYKEERIEILNENIRFIGYKKAINKNEIEELSKLNIFCNSNVKNEEEKSLYANVIPLMLGKNYKLNLEKQK